MWVRYSLFLSTLYCYIGHSIIIPKCKRQKHHQVMRPRTYSDWPMHSTPCPPVLPTFPSRHASTSYARHFTNRKNKTDGTTIQKISIIFHRLEHHHLKIELLTVLPHIPFENTRTRRRRRNFFPAIYIYICIYARRQPPLFVIDGIRRRRRWTNDRVASAGQLTLARLQNTDVRTSFS